MISHLNLLLLLSGSSLFKRSYIMRILIFIFFISNLLYPMGSNINYDDKYHEEEIKEVDRAVVHSHHNRQYRNPINPLKNIILESFVFQERNGKNIKVKRVKIGSSVVYINRVINSNSEPRSGIIVKNPIPNGAKYINGSAICDGGCIISYSTDGGTTLTQKESRSTNYNYIEFLFKTIPAYKEYRMGFRAIINK